MENISENISENITEGIETIDLIYSKFIQQSQFDYAYIILVILGLIILCVGLCCCCFMVYTIYERCVNFIDFILIPLRIIFYILFCPLIYISNFFISCCLKKRLVITNV